MRTSCPRSRETSLVLQPQRDAGECEWLNRSQRPAIGELLLGLPVLREPGVLPRDPEAAPGVPRRSLSAVLGNSAQASSAFSFGFAVTRKCTASPFAHVLRPSSLIHSASFFASSNLPLAAASCASLRIWLCDSRTLGLARVAEINSRPASTAGPAGDHSAHNVNALN